MRFAACPFFFFFFILLALRSCAPSSGLGLSGKSPVTSLGKSQASGAFCMRVCVCVCEGVCFVFPNKGQVGQCTCPRCLQTAVTAVRAHGNSFHLKVQDYSWTLTEKRFFFSLSKIKRRLKKSVFFFFKIFLNLSAVTWPKRLEIEYLYPDMFLHAALFFLVFVSLARSHGLKYPKRTFLVRFPTRNIPTSTLKTLGYIFASFPSTKIVKRFLRGTKYFF